MAANSTFGPFSLDPRSGVLTRNGLAVPLQAQPSRVLAYLVDHAGAVVSREELRRAIWGEAWVDFDQGLNYCIRQIRIALEDDARSPRYLQTLPQRGYRFIAAVNAAAPPPRRMMRPALIAACAVVVGTGVGLSAARLVVREMAPAPLSERIVKHLDPIHIARGTWTHHLKPLLTASAPTPDSSFSAAVPGPARPGSSSRQ